MHSHKQNTYTGLVDHIDDADELATQGAGCGLGDAASFDVAGERLESQGGKLLLKRSHNLTLFSAKTCLLRITANRNSCRHGTNAH